MKLKQIMTEAVLVVTADTIAEDAWHKMQLEQVRHLVVMEGPRVIGVVSERDLGGKEGFDLVKGKTVGDFTSKDMITAGPDDTVQDAALLLRGYNIGCLPVVENEKLVGIVTISDLLSLIAQGTFAEVS